MSMDQIESMPEHIMNKMRKFYSIGHLNCYP